jgi:hypothetical protein
MSFVFTILFTQLRFNIEQSHHAPKPDDTVFDNDILSSQDLNLFKGVHVMMILVLFNLESYFHGYKILSINDN